MGIYIIEHKTNEFENALTIDPKGLAYLINDIPVFSVSFGTLFYFFKRRYRIKQTCNVKRKIIN